MNRADVLRVAGEYAEIQGGPPVDWDSLDFLDVAMQLEEDHGAALPQFFSQLVPPPPYANVDAFADAVMAYQGTASGVARPEGT